MRHTIVVGIAMGVCLGVAALAPASADSSTGTVTITFTKKAWKAINSEMMVQPFGKAQKAGCIPIRDIYCTPKGKTNASAKRSFTFPGYAYGPETIASKGGLKFVRATAGLTIKSFTADFSNGVMGADVVGIGTDMDLFDLANVKNGRKASATLNLAAGQATMLNDALKTQMFRDGMTVAAWNYWPD